ncbi:MAG: hydrogenase maturation nickel metallochaperone HypA [Candidatus Sabulitectum sp.]|nr:hydrogenase maturation nickel metallochaperone HypA [Candidatus Sabulitectum sp.]
MHELSLAVEVIHMAEGELVPGFSLKRITLSVGMLSSVNPDSLQFCLESLLEQKGHRSVQLELNRIEALLLCRDCGIQYKTADVYEPCPGCSSFHREVLSGRDLIIDSVEMTGEE